MNDDKAWDRIVNAVDEKFGITDHGRSKRPVEDANEFTENVSYVVFERDGERLKLERVLGPAIIDRKTVGAKRAGATLTYKNVYDPEETSAHTNLFRENAAGEWEAIDPSALGL